MLSVLDAGALRVSAVVSPPSHLESEMTPMITMNRVRALAAALLGVVLVAPSAIAQAGSGNAVISGLVQSEFGRPLEAAQVYITELSISVASDADGRYSMSIPAARVSGQQVNL